MSFFDIKYHFLYFITFQKFAKLFGVIRWFFNFWEFTGRHLNLRVAKFHLQVATFFVSGSDIFVTGK